MFIQIKQHTNVHIKPYTKVSYKWNNSPLNFFKLAYQCYKKKFKI